MCCHVQWTRRPGWPEQIKQKEETEEDGFREEIERESLVDPIGP